MSKKNKRAAAPVELRSATLANERAAVLAEAERIVQAAQAGEEPRELTPYEAQRVDELTARAQAIVGEISDAKIAEAMEARDAVAAQRAKEDAKAAQKREAKQLEKQQKAAEARNALGLGNVHVRNNEHTYFKDGPFNYMRDLMVNALPHLPGWQSAHDRLIQHSKEIAQDARDAEQRMAAGNRTWRDTYFTQQVRHGMAYSMRSSGNYADAQIEFNAQYRDLSTAAGAGGEWVPPLYLTELWVPFARPGRVFADSMTRKPLPPGTMSMNIPVVTTGTTVAAQGQQNTNVSDTDLQTEYDTFPVVTIAGAQLISLQLIERSPIAVDDAVFGDLHLACAQELDRECIVGGLNQGEITGLLNTSGVIDVAWNTGGSSTPIEGLYGVTANAKAQIATKRFLPATHVFFTPNRWEWLEQQFDSQGRPLIVPAENGAFILAQVAPDEPVAEGVTGGRLLSMVALQDFNVPANLGSGADQDAIIVSHMSDNWLYESPIIARALPQTYGQQLTVLIQIYEYAAATFARYPFANAYITGSNLTNPITYNS